MSEEQRNYGNKLIFELTDRFFGVAVDDNSYNYPLSTLVDFLNQNLDFSGGEGDVNFRVIDYGNTSLSIVDSTNLADPIIVTGSDIVIFKRSDPVRGEISALLVSGEGTYGSGATQISESDLLFFERGFASSDVNHDETTNFVQNEHIEPDANSLVIEGGVLVVKKVNDHTVESDVPADAEFTDTQNPLSDTPTLNDSGTAASTVATNVLNTDIQNHIGDSSNPHNVLATQISDFQAQVSLNSDVVLNTAYRNVGHVPLSEKGTPNGVATLDGSGLVPVSQLPSFVQADWDETDPLAGAFIQNKPSDVTNLSIHSTDELTQGLTNLYYSNTLVSNNADVLANTNYRGVGHIPLSQKAAMNGVAPLDGSGIVPSIHLPAFVDEIEEYASFSSFPTTGIANIIYLALDSNLTYRWSGSVYVLISPSDVDSVFGRIGSIIATIGDYTTDLVTENGGVLYFTNQRARLAIDATGDLSYNSTTGVINYTGPTDLSSFSNGPGYLTSGTAMDLTTNQSADGIKTFIKQAIFNNSIRIPLSPTSGYVLTTDAAGNGTWQAPTGGHDPVTISGQSYLSLIGQNINALQVNLTSHVTGILPVLNGGTNSSTASGARINLGLAIGSDVQAWDGDLDAIAALAGTSGLLRKTAVNTWLLDTSDYITGNETITLSGDVTGSGTTSIVTTVGDDSHNHTSSTITLASTDLTDTVDLIRFADVDDMPVDGATTIPISSNWAFDHTATTNAHHDLVTITGEDYVSLSGQQITFSDIDLTSNVTGILPNTNGGTGINNFALSDDPELNISTTAASTIATKTLNDRRIEHTENEDYPENYRVLSTREDNVLKDAANDRDAQLLLPITSVDATAVFSFTDLSGITIISYSGDQVLSISGNDIISSGVGNVHSLLLSNGDSYPLPHLGYGYDSNGDAVELTVSGGVTEGYDENGSTHLLDKGAIARNPELVVNGGFDTDTDWNKNPNWTIDNGVAIADGTTSENINQGPDNAIIGESYIISFDIVSLSAGQFYAAYGGGNTAAFDTIGTHTDIVKAVSTTRAKIVARNFANGSVDNISVKLATPDYIPNNNEGQAILPLVEGDTFIAGSEEIGTNTTTFIERLFETGNTNPSQLIWDKSNALIWKQVVRDSDFYDAVNTGDWHNSELNQAYIDENVEVAYADLITIVQKDGQFESVTYSDDLVKILNRNPHNIIASDIPDLESTIHASAVDIALNMITDPNLNGTDLTTDVRGILPVENGGTGINNFDVNFIARTNVGNLFLNNNTFDNSSELPLSLRRLGSALGAVGMDFTNDSGTSKIVANHNSITLSPGSTNDFIVGISDVTYKGDLVFNAGNSNLNTVDWTAKDLVAETIQLITGATDGYILTSDASGNATWQVNAGISTPALQEVTTEGATTDVFTVFNGGISSSTGTKTRFGFNAASVGTGSNTTAFGYKAGEDSTNGFSWTAIGSFAGASNTTGDAWVAVGRSSATSNTSGDNFVSIGAASGQYVALSSGYITIGHQAADSLNGGGNATSISNSVYIGKDTKVSANGVTNENVFGYGALGGGINTVTLGNLSVLEVITTGEFNSSNASPLASSPGGIPATNGYALIADGSGGSSWTSISTGTPTLQEVTTEGSTTSVVTNFTGGITSTFATASERFGFNAGVNTTGIWNSAFGYEAATLTTSGQLYTAIGYRAGASNITGGSWTAIGSRAGENMTTGGSWTSVGQSSARSMITGSNWTSVGGDAAGKITTGNNWVAIGTAAALKLNDNNNNATDFTNSTYIGSSTKVSENGVDNETVIGYNAEGAGSNTVRLGNTSVTDVHSSGTFNSSNDSPLSSSPGGTPAADGNVLTADGSGNSSWESIDVFKKATQTLTGTAPTYNCSTSVNAGITLSGNTTVTLTNLVDGMSGNFKITQDSGGNGYTLTLSPTPKVINGGSGTITLTNTANAIDILSWWYDGTTLFTTYGSNYN